MTLWTIVHQAPLSMGFSRQEHWSGLPFPSPGDLSNPGIKHASPALAGEFFTAEPPGSPTQVRKKPTLNELLRYPYICKSIFGYPYYAYSLVCKLEYYDYKAWLVTFQIYFFIVLLYCSLHSSKFSLYFPFYSFTPGLQYYLSTDLHIIIIIFVSSGKVFFMLIF